MLPLVHYPVACRACWMPGANEVLRCPRKYFLFIPQNFRRPFYQLANFRTIRYLDAPSRAASCPGNDIFLFIFRHLGLPTFFLHKTGPVDAPPGWMPGAVAPSAPPLHATGTTLIMLTTQRYPKGLAN